MTNQKNIKQYQKIKLDDSQIINTKLESLENEVSIYKTNFPPLTSLENAKLIYPSNCLSNLTFNWVYQTLKKAKTKQIKVEDLGKISPSFNSEDFFNEIKAKWFQYNKSIKRIPLFRTILKTNLSQILQMLILSLVKSLLEIINIYLFRQILLSFKKNNQEQLIFPFPILIISMLLFKIIFIFLSRKCNFLVSFIGSKTVLQLNTLVYDKLLRTVTYNKNNYSEGELINYIENDSEKFGEFLADCPSTIIFPYQLCFYIYLLFQYFGPSFLFGFAGLIVMLIFIAYFQKSKTHFQKLHKKARDDRMNIITQAFNMIKIIKLYSWEKVFINKIEEKRRIEVELLKKINHQNLIIGALYWSGNIILSLISITFYSFFNHEMNTANILTSIYIFNSLSEPLNSLPLFFTSLKDSLISLSRIEKF